MQLQQVDIFHIQIPLAIVYETSYQPNHNLDKLILRIRSKDHTVFSECVCKDTPGSTYETPSTALAILKEFILPLIFDKQPQGPNEYAGLVKGIKGHNMAKASLECAYWALKGLEKGCSVASLLGGAKKKVPVGMGIGVQKSTARLLDLVDKYLDMGFGRIKLKIKPGWDLKPLEAVRGKYPDLPLMVDANTAYDYEKDIDTLLGLDSFGLTMIEQPLIWEDLYYHALLKKRLDTPVCLDESIISPYGAKIAALMQACDIVNIKQGRVGGLLPSVEIHDLAQKNGIGCWVGQMIESGVGISYGLALASCDNCLFHNDTLPVLVYAKDDFIEPCLTLNPDSTVDVPQKPGLGVEVDEAKINHYAIGHRVFRPGK